MRVAAPLAACLLAACAAAPTPTAPRTIELPNAGFEADFPAGARCAARWACKSHADPDSHRFYLDESAPAAGRRSLCIERVTPEPWALATVTTSEPSLRGARVRFSMAVRVDGGAGAGGPWVVVHGASGNLFHDQRLAKPGPGWGRMAIEFDVPREAQLVELGATLEGAGRVCIDDARLEILASRQSLV